jgi:hypothetical protein
MEKRMAEAVAERMNTLDAEALNRCDGEARGFDTKLATCLGIRVILEASPEKP